jgi:hypothetical protein
MKRSIPALEAGSLVGIFNCVGWFKVIRRTRPNFYLVDFKGKEVEIPRVQLTSKKNN